MTPGLWLLLDDPRAVGVGHEDVVELGQEARGRGRRGVGERGAGNVEQLGAALVAEAAQARAQAVDHRAHAGQARPRADIGDAGRPEGGEVAQDGLVGRAVALERTAQPCLGGRQPRLRARAREQRPARRHLHQPP